MRLPAPIFALLLALLSAAPAQAELRRFALVVGSNRSDAVSAAPLLYADDDAMAMQDLLAEAGVESVLLTSPDEDTRRLHPTTTVAGPATQTALEAAFDAQRARMQEARTAGAEVDWLFFFSGHGDVDHGQGFLGLEQGRLTRSALHDQLIARAPAQHVHVVIDACRSALMVLDKGPGGRRERLTATLLQDATPRASVGFVVSSSSARQSHEWERFQSGVFSYEVRSALRGAADVNGDGIISYAELGAFLQNANLGIPSPQYRPDFLVVPPDGSAGFAEQILTWPTAAGLALNASAGHVYVERQSGERLLDANAAADSDARLFLPEERPLFIRAADETSERVLATLDPSASGDIGSLPIAPAATRAKGALSSALQGLFGSPFGAGAVAAWVQGWAPPDLSVESVDNEPSQRFSVLRPALGWAAIGALVVGAVGFGIAQEQAAGGSALSGANRASHNQAISIANGVGVTGAVVAGTAAAGWLALLWWGGRAPVAVEPAVAPNAAGASVDESW